MEETQEIKEYLNRLPASARQAVLSADWHSRVSDISKKYSLGPEQTNNLEYEILFVLLGMEADTDFTENIKKQLNISELLASQIDEEVNSRVFTYLLDMMEKKQPLSKAGFDRFEKGSTVPRPAFDTNKIPEIKPDNLPQKISPPKYIPPYKPTQAVPNNVPGQVIAEQKNQGPMLPKITFSPKNPPPPTNAPASQTMPPSQIIRPAQTPLQEQGVSKPAFDTKKSEPVLQTPQNIIDNKLNNVTGGIKEEPRQEETSPQKYNVDPYREPIN